MEKDLALHDDALAKIEDEIEHAIEALKKSPDREKRERVNDVQKLLRQAQTDYRAFSYELRQYKGSDRGTFMKKGTEHDERIQKLIQDFNWARQGRAPAAGEKGAAASDKGGARDPRSGREKIMGGSGNRAPTDEELNARRGPKTINDAETPDEAFQMTYAVQDKSKATVDRMNRRAAQMSQVAAETQSELQRQGEEMRAADEQLDNMKVNLKRAGRKLTEIARAIACDKLIMAFMVLVGAAIIFIIVWKIVKK